MSTVTDPIILDSTGQRIAEALENQASIGDLTALKTTAKSSAVAAINENYDNIEAEGVRLTSLEALINHNIPRKTPKDITSYISDGSIWNRLNGLDGYELYEDLYVGDYWKVTEAISAYNQNPTYQLAGSDYVTIIGIDSRMGDGDGGGSVSVVNYHHLVMTAGKGFGGTQHFGRSRMNSANDTTGGYVGSEMHTTTIGAVTSTGKRASADATATINQQLYAEFGTHLKTTRELLSNAINATGANRLTGTGGGCASGWAWTSCQAVLMSEIEVYGSIAFGASGHDIGNACRQFPLFAHNREAQNNRSSWYWLKDIASAANFCRCNYNGVATYHVASYADTYVRPRFILAA